MVNNDELDGSLGSVEFEDSQAGTVGEDNLSLARALVEHVAQAHAGGYTQEISLDGRTWVVRVEAAAGR